MFVLLYFWGNKTFHDSLTRDLTLSQKSFKDEDKRKDNKNVFIIKKIFSASVVNIFLKITQNKTYIKTIYIRSMVTEPLWQVKGNMGETRERNIHLYRFGNFPSASHAVTHLIQQQSKKQRRHHQVKRVTFKEIDPTEGTRGSESSFLGFNLL